MPRLAQHSYRLSPPKYFLDPFPFALAHLVSMHESVSFSMFSTPLLTGTLTWWFIATSNRQMPWWERIDAGREV
jgi:hypothetical protein